MLDKHRRSFTPVDDLLGIEFVDRQETFRESLLVCRQNQLPVMCLRRLSLCSPVSRIYWNGFHGLVRGRFEPRRWPSWCPFPMGSHGMVEIIRHRSSTGNLVTSRWMNLPQTIICDEAKYTIWSSMTLAKNQSDIRKHVRVLAGKDCVIESFSERNQSGFLIVRKTVPHLATILALAWVASRMIWSRRD